MLTVIDSLLGLHDHPELPQTPRYRLLHLPSTLSSHARQRTLKIASAWRWTDAFILCWQRLGALPARA